MSIEIRASYPCPHLLVEEPVAIGADRRSLIPVSPIGGAGSVRILMNDTVYVPPGGLFSQASLASGSPAPYKIQRCVDLVGPKGNELSISTPLGAVTVALPEGRRVALADIQRVLKLSPANALVVVGEKNGALSLTDRSLAGVASFVRVSGNAAASLGFKQTGARGRQIYPGWGIIAKPSTYPSTYKDLRDSTSRYVLFNQPLKGSPAIKMTYTSTPERCRRCRATYVENDWRFNAEGAVLTVRNEDLLYQACLKAILTVRNSNPYHPAYGSKVTTRVGHKLTGTSAMLIRQDVQGALQQVQGLQAGQRKYQSVTNREMLYQIVNVDVRPSADDPTVFFVDVSVRNASNQPINLSTVFSVPGTIALAGSNRQVLGLETAGLSPQQASQVLLDG